MGRIAWRGLRFWRRSRYSSMVSSARSSRVAPGTGCSSKSPPGRLASIRSISWPGAGTFSAPRRINTRPSSSACSSPLRSTRSCTATPSGTANGCQSTVRTGGRQSLSARRTASTTSSSLSRGPTLPSASIPSTSQPPSLLAKATRVSARSEGSPSTQYPHWYPGLCNPARSFDMVRRLQKTLDPARLSTRRQRGPGPPQSPPRRPPHGSGRRVSSQPPRPPHPLRPG